MSAVSHAQRPPRQRLSPNAAHASQRTEPAKTVSEPVNFRLCDIPIPISMHSGTRIALTDRSRTSSPVVRLFVAVWSLFFRLGYCSFYSGKNLLRIIGAVLGPTYYLVFVLCHDDNGRRISHVQPRSKVEIRLYLFGKASRWIENKGHLLAMMLKPQSGKVLKVFFAADLLLGSKYIGPVLARQLWTDFILNVACTDSPLEGPYVSCQWKIMTEKRDMGALDCLEFIGMCVSASRTP